MDDIKALLDREQIRDCIARLARGEDRRDAELIKRCYWQDANLDFGIFTGSFAEYLAWVVPGSPAVLLTLHTLGQSLIELRAATAAVETHVTSYHRIDMGEQHRDIVIGGRYLDRLEKREGGVAHRSAHDALRLGQRLRPVGRFQQGCVGCAVQNEALRRRDTR